MKLATTPSRAIPASWVSATFSLVVYIYSVLSLISWWLFLVPDKYLFTSLATYKLYSMDTAPTVDSVFTALGQNLGAIFLFGFTHSLFARKSAKAWMALPVSVERSFYCLQGGFFLHLLQMFWVEVDSTTIWDASASPPFRNVCLAVFWLGSAVLLSATFALDHFHLFGLSQGFGMDLNEMLGLTPLKVESGLVSRWHYRIVAHPIMTGMLINFWATPIMTPSRLVLALFMTVYVVIAVVRFEEPFLHEHLGESYKTYLKKTPRFFPSSSYKLKISIEKKKEN